MTAITHHDIGDVWVAQATFTVGGTPTDPTTITVKQQAPDGTETVIASAVTVSGLNASSTPVAKVSTGVLKLNPGITLDTAGHWYVKFSGVGAAQAAETHEAIVDPDVFTSESGISARALVTLGEAKDWLQQRNIDTSEDLELVRAINDISDRIYEEAGREFKVFGTNPQTRLFDADEQAVCIRTVDVGDLAAFSAVQIEDKDGTVLATVSAADVVSLPRNRAPWEPVRQLRFTSDVRRLRWGDVVSVAGTWGFPSVPGNIRQACLDGVAAVLDRDVEHYRQDLAPGTPEGSSVVLMQRPVFLSLPASVLAVAWSYRDLLVA